MNDSNTILRPPWLNIARAVWIVLALAALFVFVVSAVETLRAPLPSCTVPGAQCSPYGLSREDLALAVQNGMSESFLIFYTTVFGWLAHLVWVLVGLLLFWRKPDDWMALLLSLMLILFVFEGMSTPAPFNVLASALYGIAVGLFMVLPFIFPNGRWIPRWTIWLGLPIIALAAFGSGAGGADQANTPPEGLLVFFGMVTVWLVGAVYAVIYRYRRISNAIERQQTKWVMTGVLGWTITLVPVTVIVVFFPPSQPSMERVNFLSWVAAPVYFFSYIFLAVCILIAVMRYRLWDIDVLIRRTVTYTLVVALLGVVYFGSVIVLQRVFAGIVGGDSEIITVLSTLAIAALFVPLRNHIQGAIDKRFNRKKYNAQQVMEKFSRTVRDETDIDTLTNELVNVVQETMQPKSVSVWLKREARSMRDEG